MTRYLYLYGLFLVQRFKVLMEYRANFLIGASSTIFLQASILLAIWVVMQPGAQPERLELRRDPADLRADHAGQVDQPHVRGQPVDHRAAVTSAPAVSTASWCARSTRSSTCWRTASARTASATSWSGWRWWSNRPWPPARSPGRRPKPAAAGRGRAERRVDLHRPQPDHRDGRLLDRWTRCRSSAWSSTTTCSPSTRSPFIPKAIGILLTWVIPYGFASFYPASYLLGRSLGWLAWLAPLVAAVSAAHRLPVWKFGLRHYAGTGSMKILSTDFRNGLNGSY